MREFVKVSVSPMRDDGECRKTEGERAKRAEEPIRHPDKSLARCERELA